MRSHFILIPIISVALASPCIGQSTEAKSANVQSGEINVALIKDTVRELYQMCHSGQLDVPDNYSIMVSFRILPDGSIPRESIHVLHSSGSRLIDKKALEILLRMGESHALGPVSALSSNTIELLVNHTVARLSMTSFAPTAEEAQAKVTQLRFLLKLVAAQLKSKHPMFSESLSHLVLKADNKRVDVEITIRCGARAAENVADVFGQEEPALVQRRRVVQITSVEGTASGNQIDSVSVSWDDGAGKSQTAVLFTRNGRFVFLPQGYIPTQRPTARMVERGMVESVPVPRDTISGYEMILRPVTRDGRAKPTSEPIPETRAGDTILGYETVIRNSGLWTVHWSEKLRMSLKAVTPGATVEAILVDDQADFDLRTIDIGIFEQLAVKAEADGQKPYVEEIRDLIELWKKALSNLSR